MHKQFIHYWSHTNKVFCLSFMARCHWCGTVSSPTHLLNEKNLWNQKRYRQTNELLFTKRLFTWYLWTCPWEAVFTVFSYKSAVIDELLGRFIRDGSGVLSKAMNELCNLCIKWGSFPDYCKIAKLKLLFIKWSKNNSSK